MEHKNTCTGKILFYDEIRKWGFLQYNFKNVFFHHSGLITKPVKMGDKVTFDLSVYIEQTVAVNIQKLEENDKENYSNSRY